MLADPTITIGQLSSRSGVAVSAIRFYEDKGLLRPLRSAGNQRRFLRSDLRRVGFIVIAQRLGLALHEIETQLASLPHGRAPTLSDWQQVSRRMRFEIDQRINLLSRARNQLDQCIGCGCLSLSKCQLYNKDDRMGAKGSGPRAILG
ncbi:MAG: redox-sensitive transcriptional activator SoxR [Croceibacterium sp.]